VLGGVLLELAQNSTAQAEATRRFSNPHALDLGGLVVVELEGPGADWLSPEGGHHQETGRKPQLLLVGRDAPRRIEAGVEPAVELGEVLADAIPSVWMGRIDWGDLDHGRGPAPLDVGCRGDHDQLTGCRADGAAIPVAIFALDGEARVGERLRQLSFGAEPQLGG